MTERKLTRGKLIVAAVIFLLLISVYRAPAQIAAPASAKPKILRGHTNSISSIDTSGDGRLIASAGLDRTVRIWDTSTGKTIRVFNGHKDEIYAVAFSPDNKMLASSDYGGKILIWSASSGRTLRTLQTSGWSVAIAFSPDSRQLAVGSQDRNITIYDALTGNILQTFETGSINTLAFSPDGRYLAAATGAVVVWERQTGKISRTLRGHQGSIKDISFSKDSRFLASASLDKTARVWNVETGENVKTFQTATPIERTDSPRPFKWKMPVTSVAFSPDGETLAAATGRAVHLWEISTGKNFQILEGHEQSVTSIRFLPGGKSLASGGLDDALRIWSLQ